MSMTAIARQADAVACLVHPRLEVVGSHFSRNLLPFVEPGHQLRVSGDDDGT